MTVETDALWSAVDSLTQPSTRRLARTQDAEWLKELHEDTTVRFCDVGAYRAATRSHGTIPSLWDQAEMTLTTHEMSDGKPSLSAQRSPADLDLMEMMLTIRETVALERRKRNLTDRDTLPEQLRQLASHVAGNEPDDLWWWEYRFAQWARVLETYLRAAEASKPKPVRLRNSICPACGSRQARIEVEGEIQVVPALYIDFHDGYVRACSCLSCAATWFRGSDLEELAAQLNARIELTSETPAPA